MVYKSSGKYYTVTQSEMSSVNALIYSINVRSPKLVIVGRTQMANTPTPVVKTMQYRRKQTYIFQEEELFPSRKTDYEYVYMYMYTDSTTRSDCGGARQRIVRYRHPASSRRKTLRRVKFVKAN